MVDAVRLLALLERIRVETLALQRLAGLPDERLAGDSDELAAVKYRFVVAIEAAVDASRHIAASEGLRVPRDMRDAFAVLIEAGWLPADEQLADMAGFRNLLVHGYADVDDERVRVFLRARLHDLDTVRRVIASRVAQSSGEPSR